MGGQEATGTLLCLTSRKQALEALSGKEAQLNLIRLYLGSGSLGEWPNLGSWKEKALN